MTAIKVYDSKTNEVIFPPEMGTPRDDQLQGCWFEKLSELAGRVCYDSLGKGRNSEDYHKHIQEVGHLSVYEHCNFNILVNKRWKPNDFRPGLYWKDLSPTTCVITFNLRSVLEWDKWGVSGDEQLNEICITEVLRHNPQFFPNIQSLCCGCPEYFSGNSHWSTYFFRCSRACSHELVRHGDFTAISQRSTRYCEEKLDFSTLNPLLMNIHLIDLNKTCQTAYNSIVQIFLEVGKTRKEALGAARCVLPHYLATEIIFSASADQWERIKQQRVSEFADIEIRELIGRVE